MELRIGGRPLVDLLLERLVECGCFNPIFIAGPARVYGERRGTALVIDTDGTFGQNIQRAVTAVTAVCPGRSIALTTCDLLPEVQELHDLMEDYYRHAPLDFWAPFILAPESDRQLGASSWKPRYRIAPAPGAEPRSLLPGHLVVADTDAARLRLIYHSFNLAYKSRNRPILYRLWLIISHVLPGLLFHDLRELFRLRMPSITYSVVSNGVALAWRLRQGVITPEELAIRVRRIYINYRHRRRYPERHGRIALLHGLSMAKDIDTEEEAEEIVDELEIGKEP